MRLGISVGHNVQNVSHFNAIAKLADDRGFSSLSVAETYGSDAVALLASLAHATTRITLATSILPLAARRPAATAMAAMTIDMLSKGRFRLGLGVSGPQVVEGWFGVPFHKPLTATREYVHLVRTIVARSDVVQECGEIYSMPTTQEGSTGLGKPLKSILHPLRPNIDIYLAATGPKNIELAAEIADGWLPLFYSPERTELFEASLSLGARRRALEHSLKRAPTVPLAVGGDITECIDRLRPYYARYFGGMGARGANFHNDLLRRYGHERAAEAVQQHYLDRNYGAANAAIPASLIDELALVGPVDRIAERLIEWFDSGVDEVLLRTTDLEEITRISTIIE